MLISKKNHTIFHDLGALVYKAQKIDVSIPLAAIPQDISVHEKIILFREDEQFHVYDRKCDHRGGAVMLNGQYY